MADNSKLRMNLSAIKKVDPYAKNIVSSSSHVAFYTFNSDCNEWEKTDVEGALFIYNRSGQPFYSIFINNRLNTTSFVEPITGHLELQSQPPFLLYRNERSRIRGFWFYNSHECDRIGSLVAEIVQTTMQTNMDRSSSTDKVDIFTLLSKAQQEYKDCTKKQPTPCNVLKFFAAAKPTTPLLNCKIPSVEQLEKQQRGKTPQNPQDQHKKNDPVQSITTAARANNNFENFQQTEVNRKSSNLALLNTVEVNQPVGGSLSPRFNTFVDSEMDIQPLMTPSVFCSPLNESKEQGPLNQWQLLQAFSYLIQNDKEFVYKLHEAYLRTFEKN